MRLRSTREAKGLTITALARATRVQPRILEAIERNDSHALPPRPYGRGFVRAYANEVGLDPDATVRDFFAQFAAGDPIQILESRHAAAIAEAAPPHARRRAAFGAVAACALAGALVIGIGRPMLTSESEPRPVGTAGAAPPATAGTAGATPPALAPAITAPAPSAPLTVTLEATAPAWITAIADGQRVLYRTMAPGERELLHADERIRLRIGDAGALRWQINGRPAVVMGAPGEVRTVVITAANAAAVK